jgi:hypothetical protein
MRIVQTRVPTSDFGTALGAMRTWLDQHNCDPVKFETDTESPATILIRVEFQAEKLAEAFQKAFDDGPSLAN